MDCDLGRVPGRRTGSGDVGAERHISGFRLRGSEMEVQGPMGDATSHVWGLFEARQGLKTDVERPRDPQRSTGDNRTGHHMTSVGGRRRRAVRAAAAIGGSLRLRRGGASCWGRVQRICTVDGSSPPRLSAHFLARASLRGPSRSISAQGARLQGPVPLSAVHDLPPRPLSESSDIPPLLPPRIAVPRTHILTQHPLFLFFFCRSDPHAPRSPGPSYPPL